MIWGTRLAIVRRLIELRRSDGGFGAQALDESLVVEVNTGHGNGGGQAENDVIENCAMLPFREKSLAEQ